MGCSGAALAPILALLSPAPAAHAASTGPIKIGLLLPVTGVLTVQGTDTTKGFELYLAKMAGKVGGRDVVVIKEDTEAKPDVGLTKLKKLVERDGVDVVVGPVSSAVALAIRPYVQAQAIPLVIPVAFSRDLTAPGKNLPSAGYLGTPRNWKIRTALPWTPRTTFCLSAIMAV